MWATKQMLATMYGCSVSTIGRAFKEMKDSGQYEGAYRQLGKLTIDTDAFERFINHRKRKDRES